MLVQTPPSLCGTHTLGELAALHPPYVDVCMCRVPVCTMFDGLGGGGVAVAMSQDAKYVAALSTSTPQVRSCTIAHGVDGPPQFQQSPKFTTRKFCACRYSSCRNSIRSFIICN